MTRRGFLSAILASATAPYVITAAGVLMPVRKVLTFQGEYGDISIPSNAWWRSGPGGPFTAEDLQMFAQQIFNLQRDKQLSLIRAYGRAP